jgi:hypothetical protein
VLFGAEEFDHSVASFQLEKAIISVGFFGYGEDRKVLFKHERKIGAWLVDQKKVGFGNVLIDEVFESVYDRKFEAVKQDSLFGHISPPPIWSWDSPCSILTLFYYKAEGYVITL